MGGESDCNFAWRVFLFILWSGGFGSIYFKGVLPGKVPNYMKLSFSSLTTLPSSGFFLGEFFIDSFRNSISSPLGSMGEYLKKKSPPRPNPSWKYIYVLSHSVDGACPIRSTTLSRERARPIVLDKKIELNGA